ncbi:MAG: efflux RND transporter periplasmic adaptor subunit [Planctomycetota bacterium]|jgi:RND family efflux transporter MFP subunit
MPPTAPQEERPGFAVRALRVLTGIMVSVVLPLGVLAVSVHYGKELLSTPQKAKRKQRERRAPLVQVRSVLAGRHATTLSVMGTVVPSRVIELRPRVSGEVIEMNPRLVTGGLLREGEVLVRIDPTDFNLAVRQREADLARAESALRLEQGQQAVARREFELLGDDVSEEEKDLILRKPQIAAAEAEVAIARAGLERAKVDLGRTEVRVPFNALVRSYDVGKGTQIATSSRIATLVSTDSCYVEVSVPVDRLSWIKLQDESSKGSAARIHASRDSIRDGHVARLVGDLEKSGRLARMRVSVEDPFCLQPSHAGSPRLLLDSYLRVEISGPELESAVAVERRHLRDAKFVWIADDEDCLRIRPVEIGHRTRDCIYVLQGLEDGDRLVLSNLPAPVDGMKLQVEEAPEPGTCETEDER